ncbi:UL10 [Human alphaherpesvirus 1]|nr:UL10 [Human alphaherpesvirus 1]UPH93068.1 UL10 [Human alphaherpesvirus 1]UPH94057.1 UL10 [Human alphaherpesvirus 1]UPH94286.1 UL10 [Human alphaherpesvirus 1]UPH94360.1 UL10 [Human alphaherpesvirus 1]
MGRPAPRGSPDSAPPTKGMTGARTAWWVWCVQVATFVVSAVCVTGLLVLASVFRARFPCFYATASSYAGVNSTAEVRGGVAVPLRLDTQSLVGTYVITAVLLLAAAVYAVVGAVTSRYDRALDAGRRLAAARMAMPHATLIAGNVCSWLLQITVLLLAHRISQLAHLVYVLHFACLVYFAAHFCTRGVLSGTYLRQVHGLMELAPTHHRVVGPARAVLTNALLLGVFLCTADAAVSLNTIAAFNFNFSAPGMLICLTVLFALLVVSLLLVVEGVLCHYVRVLVGPHLGAVAATGIVGLACEHYYTNGYYVVETQWPGAQTGVRVALALVAAFALGMAVLRCTRAYLYHRRHHTKFFMRMRDTRHRAHSALKRVRSSMRGSRDGRHRPAPGSPPGIPEYAEDPYAISYGGQLDRYGDSDGEPIYDEVADDQTDVLYAKIQHPRHLPDDDPIYDTVGGYDPEPAEDPVYSTVRRW